MRLSLGDRRRHDRLSDEAPHDDVDGDGPDLRPSFFDGDEVGGGDPVADVRGELSGREILYYLCEKLQL